MSCIYERRGTWYIQYYHKGVLVQKSLRTKDKRMANQLQKLHDLELAMGKLDIVKGKVPVPDTFRKFLELKQATLKSSTFVRYKGMSANVVTFLESINRAYMNDLTDDEVAKFITVRRGQGASNKTITEELLLLKAAFKMLSNKGHLTACPIREWPVVCKTAKKPDTIGGYTPEEIRQIKKFFEGHPTEDYFLGLIYTGCRRSELWAIKKMDVNFNDNSLRIRSLKTGTTPTNQFRFVEIHKELKKVLVRRCETLNANDTVFPMVGRGLWLIKTLKKACEKLGIQYRRLHGLRHAFISALLNVGVPLRAVMAMAGHSNFSTTLRYSHISQNDLRGKINQLEF